MALTLKEKRFYQNQLFTALETLKKGGLTLKEASAARQQLSEAMEKLEGSKPEKTLYQRLADGEFNSLQWQQFAAMCGRITQEENVPWTDLHKYIFAWMDENEPEGGYNYAAIMKPQESTRNTDLYSAVRKALKNMPMDDAERRMFEQWQSSDSQSVR